MRGEKLIYYADGQATSGSPPHARGKAVPALLNVVNVRITPACAGKSQYLST